MIRKLFELYAATPLSLAIRHSSWAFAVIEVLHLIALAALGGALLVGGLRLIAPAFRFADRTEVWRGLRPVIGWSLAAAIGSGVLLVGSNPLKYYFNDAFRWKMALLASALVVTVATDRLASATANRRALAAGAAAAADLALWLGVGLAGRLIGLL